MRLDAFCHGGGVVDGLLRVHSDPPGALYTDRVTGKVTLGKLTRQALGKIPDDIIRRVYREMAARGGRARASALTAAQRRAIAKRAARARWAGHKKERS